MDSEIIIEDDNDDNDNNHEESIPTTPVLKSNENKNVKAASNTCEKKKKKGVLNLQWLLDSQLGSFLREYKPDSTKALCIACNEKFSIHYGGKNDIDRHIKLKRHIHNMKSFSINRQLITSTMKPNKESEEVAAAEGIIDLIDDADESATNTFENLEAAIKKSGLSLEGLTSIGADNTNVNMDNTHSVYTLFHDQVENLFKGNCYCHILHNGVKWGHQQLTVDVEKFLMMAYAHFSRSAKRVQELKSYYEFYENNFQVLIKHIKIRWLSLYLSIDRLLLVYKPVKEYFTDQSNRETPKELEKNFQSEETLCILTFLHHILFEIQKTNLELQKKSITAIDLYRIITSIQYKPKQRLDTSFFGIQCRNLLNRMSSDTSAELQASFKRFILTFLEYIDKYFSQNVAFLEAIGHFGYGIENLTWNQVQKCIEITKIKGLNEDDLFNEFTELKLTFEMIQKKEVPLLNQIQFFLSNEGQEEIRNSSTTSIHQSESDEEDEEEQTKVIRSDQLWAMLLAVNATPTPNMKKLICFLYSIPASNAYVESIFSDMKHLLSDSRNRMSVDLVSAELQIRRNSSLSCTDMHQYLLSDKELLGAISSNNKYAFKKQRVQ
ncbi:unnamed protein product [Rotaria socialis]